jgi:two-component system sensor histidine kinase ChvG
MGRAFTQMTNALYDRLDAIESFAADVSRTRSRTR